MDGIRATPMQYPILGLLADKLKKAQQFAVAPGGYANPPAEILLNLLGIPAVQQTMERVAYGEPLTTGRGMTTQVRPEVAEAAMTLLPAAAGTARVAERGAMAAGRAGERMAERMVPQIMERGGMPAGLLEGMSSRTVSPLTVYHGSPAKFERFDPTKIGSGEGAQAYGYGHYVAQAKETAEDYRKRLSDWGSPYTYQYQGQTFAPTDERVFDPVRHAIQLTYHQGKKVAQDIAKSGLLDAKKGEAYAIEMGGVPYYEKMLEVAKGINKKDIQATQGFTYEIDLPDEQIAKMLDWDKPFNEQPKNVQEFFANHPAVIERLSQINAERTKLNELYPGRLTNPKLKDIVGKETTVDSLKGSKLYEILTSGASIGKDEAARVDAMRQAGVPGIRYLDQGSRGAGEGTSNFVVFPGNEGLLTIQKRNNEVIAPTSLLDKSPQSEALLTAQRNAAKPIEEGGLGLPSNNTAMDRAKAMGFDVDTTMYHATDKDFSAFIPSTKGKLGAGVYLSPSSRYAEKYVGDEARVLPVISRGKFADDAQRTEIADAVREEMMKSNPNFSVQDWKRNIDKAMQDLGFDGTEMYMERTVYDPSLIRSRFAAFDPSRIKENDLLAGVLPLSLLADEEQKKKADAYFRSLLGQ